VGSCIFEAKSSKRQWFPDHLNNSGLTRTGKFYL
jgi:hypothetical protein